MPSSSDVCQEFTPFSGKAHRLAQDGSIQQDRRTRLKRKSADPDKTVTRPRVSIEVECVECSSDEEDQGSSHLKHIREMEFMRQEIGKMGVCASTWEVPPGKYFNKLREDVEHFSCGVVTFMSIMDTSTEKELAENDILVPMFEDLASDFSSLSHLITRFKCPLTGPTASSQDEYHVGSDLQIVG